MLSPGGAGWSHTDYMLADLYDAVSRNAYYSALAAGVKRPKKPKPYPRPGVTPAERDVKTFRTKPMPVDEMRRWLGWD